MEIEQNIFFDEFKNKLISLENALIDVNQGDSSTENINEIFRSIHTIKGTADLLGLFEIVALTHKSEDLLQFIRDDTIEMNQDICKLFIELKNFIALLVENVSQGIFDDSSTEKLFNTFENELNHQIYLAENKDYKEKAIKTILVVDDSALIRYTVKKIAADEGYNVLTSDNTLDGWKKIQENAIDLLLCDFSAPNNDFIEFAETIRTDFSMKNLPIVMILSKNDNNINALGQQIKATAWITKPIEANKLKLILKKILAKK
jgi:chemotaxis protein histidine kinase CheA